MKKKIPLLFLLLVFSCWQLSAQETILRTVRQAKQELSSQLPTTWTLPKSSESITINWQPRRSSFATEGIQTFAAYVGDDFVGTAAIQRNTISGQITWQGVTYDIYTQNEQLLLKPQADAGHCGNCCRHHHDEKHTSSKISIKNNNTPVELFDDEPQLYSDGVLRYYRLALLVEYNMFVSAFNSDIQRVKQFWANTETTLNEIYLRDLGIQFQVVNNNHLIRKTQEEQLHNPSASSESIIAVSTQNINQVIGEDKYDVGVVITKSGSSSIAGKAALYGAFSKGNKGYALATNNAITIGHEIGHLFGAEHTFTSGGDITMKTEPEAGTSIMSYGHGEKRDFFSLACIWYIKNAHLNSKDYYTTPQRTESIGPNNSDNIPYGILTQNRAPVIDRSKIKKTYRIPKQTEFQFRIPAVDPDGDPLYYAAHQTDIRRRTEVSISHFRSYKPTRNNLIVYQPTYSQDDGSVIPNTASDQYPKSAPIGTYTFWLAAYDALSNEARESSLPHCTRYDMVKTSVEIAEGTPFKFTGISKDGTPLRKGEKRTIKWSVDRNFFPAGSKVRILLSDDLGHNFPYVLEESTDNDGEHEVIIPHIEPKSVKKFGRNLGEPAYYSNSSLVFKIEVIDHIAHAISNNDIRGGGLELTDHRYITFNNIPPHSLTLAAGEAIPAAPTVTAKNKTGKNLNVTMQQENITPNCIKRTWTAVDGASQVYLVQHVYLTQADPQLKFVGDLPADMQVSCLKDIPARQDPQYSSSAGTEVKMHFQQTQIKGDEPCYTVRRIWTLTAPDAKPVSHTQTIIVHDHKAPEFSTKPKHMVVSSPNQIPTQATLTAIDDCDGSVTITPTYTSIWDSQNNREGGRIYQWVAKDRREQEARYEQYIFVDYDGTLVKKNVAELKRELPNKNKKCIARISNLTVTYNDGWKAYLEDNTGGMLVHRLPKTFKAGDRLTDNFELILEVGNGSDKYNRDIFEYRAHEGGVKATAQELPLARITLQELLTHPNNYQYRRVMVEGTTQGDLAFSKGKMTLHETGNSSGTSETLAVKGEFATPVAASRVPLAVIGYYATNSTEGAFLDVVQQQDVWGKLSVSPHKFATYYINAPFTLPTQAPAFAQSSGTLQGGIITAAEADGDLTLDYRFQPGSVVPTETPILLHAEEGVHYYNFTIDTPDPITATNYLRGSHTTQTFTAQNSEKFYHLTDSPTFGFYWQHGTNGNSVVNNAGRCYLALPYHLASSTQGFRLEEGNVTSVQTMPTDSTPASEVYDLSGRRVRHATSGIYISQGKKIIR